MSNNNEILQFRETLRDLKEKMFKMLKMCEGRDFKQNEALELLNDGLINLIDIKSLNRHIQGEVENIKDFLNNEKEKVEGKNLHLQNNLYQKENIVSQINSCINFPTIEMNKIELPNKSEVLEYFSEKAIEKKEEDFKLMDYLECELGTRKKLNENVNDLQKEKEENIAKQKEFEKFFSDLPKYFENLDNSTLKAQKYLNLNFKQKNQNLNLSGNLPTPLFIIYNTLQCFVDESIDTEINIKGQEERVEEFYSKYTNFFNYGFANKNASLEIEVNEEMENKQKEEGEHSEGEIEDEEILEKKNSKKKKKPKKGLMSESYIFAKRNKSETNLTEEQLEFKKIVIKLSTKEEKFNKFPLYVEFIIKGQKVDKNEYDEEISIYPIILKFFFIPLLNIVSVDVSCAKSFGNEDTKNNFRNFNTNHILYNIFHPPASLLTVIRDKLESILSECCNEYGKNEKIFDYMQILSNNHLFNLNGIKEFYKHYVNYKNIKNKSIINISADNSTLTDLNFIDNEISQFDNFGNLFDNTDSINMDNFICRIKDRINYLPNLLNQVEYLIKFLCLKSEILNEFKAEKKFQIIKEKTKIINVKKISKLDYYSKYEEIFNPNNDGFKYSSFFNFSNSEKIYEKITSFSYQNIEAIYLNIEFERKNYKINSFVEIRFDFPSSAPRFFLIMDNVKTSFLNIPEELMDFVNKENNMDDFKPVDGGFSNILRDIENEVNEYCLESLINNKKLFGWTFSYQIRTLQMCIDAFADKDNSKYNSYFKFDKNTNKRKRPFLFYDVY